MEYTTRSAQHNNDNNDDGDKMISNTVYRIQNNHSLNCVQW